MPNNAAEIERRRFAAIFLIKSTLGTDDGEFGSTLFASHHLEEIEPSYWQERLGTDNPTPEQVLDILELRSHWGEEEDGIEVFDFTLPGDVTNYVLSVRFDDAGEIEEVSMES
jgi:hypothetical protein